MTDKNNSEMEEISSEPIAKKADEGNAKEQMPPSEKQENFPPKDNAQQDQQEHGDFPKVKASSLAKPAKSNKGKDKDIVKPIKKGDNFSAKEKTKSWYYARYQSVVVQRNILLLFALLSMVAVTISVVFVRSVTASKSLEPYVVEIEEKTGVPVVVEQLSKQYLTGNQMIIRYFLNQYIHAASGFDPRLYKSNVTKVRLLSSPGVYMDFRRRINPKDFSNGASMQVRIKSIQFPGPNTAQVRILKVITKENSTNTVNELINIDFRFTDLVLTAEERLINPLGFQVGRYMITEEIYEY